MHALGNLFEHYFRRATTNRVHTRISCHAFDGALSYESHPAMELQAGVHDLVNELATVSLHHRNLSGCFNSAGRQPGCMEDKLPPSLSLGGQHRQAMTDRLFRP
jgi:long-subunit fatty acid transport protein